MRTEQFVFLDFETTGLDPSRCRVIEIGALRMDIEGVVHDRFSCLVSYDGELPNQITDLTGITDALLRQEGIPSRHAFEGLRAFMGNTQCVAFNADFDRAFLEREIAYHGLKPMVNQFRCALAAARDAWPVFRSHALSALCTFLNIERTAHRALSDASAGAQVFLRAANAIWSDRRLTHFATDNLFISRIDIENLFGCATGDKLDLWTKPDRESINAYALGSIGGSGLTLVLPKEHNAPLMEAMRAGVARHLGVDREGHSTFTFTYSQ
jgi:DNA polymerase III alpha subunit (gram-positive type)